MFRERAVKITLNFIISKTFYFDCFLSQFTIVTRVGLKHFTNDLTENLHILRKKISNSLLYSTYL